MNKLETGLQASAVVADAAIPAPIGASANQGLIYNGSSWIAAAIVNAHISASAAIAYSKLALAGSIINNDISNSASIAYSKLSLTGTINNTDISNSAAITGSKLATGVTGPPASEVDYAQITSNVNSTATTEATANTIITGNAVTYDGSTSIIVEFFSASLNKGTTNINIWLYDGAASIGEIAFSTAVSTPALARRKLTPSAAAHTYSIRASVDAGTGSVAAGVGGVGTVMPAYIRITKA